MRLWPCYMLTSSLVLILAPMVGLFFSAIVVYAPFIILAHRAANGKLKVNKQLVQNIQLRIRNRFSIPKCFESRPKRSRPCIAYN